MEKQLNYVVDNIEINPYVIQLAYDEAKNKNKTNEVLGETFKVLALLQAYQSNPSDSALKQNIKNIANNKMIPSLYEEKPIVFEIDLTEVYPLNKPGTFGRELERKCRLTTKGVLQFEDNSKDAKLKELKDFIYRVENYGEKDIDNKIGWITDHKKFPFRIILIDKNDNHKGLYISSHEKAQNILVFLSQQYKYKSNAEQLFKNLNKNVREANQQEFVRKLLHYGKMNRKSIRYSRNINLQNNSKEKPQSSIENMQQITEKRSKNEDLSRSIFNRQSNTRTQFGYDGNYLNQLLNKHEENQKRSSLNPNLQSNQLNFGAFFKMEEKYKRQLIKLWLGKAKQQETRKIEAENQLQNSKSKKNNQSYNDRSIQNRSIDNRSIGNQNNRSKFIIPSKQVSSIGKSNKTSRMREEYDEIQLLEESRKDKNGSKKKESYIKGFSNNQSIASNNHNTSSNYHEPELQERIQLISIQFLTLTDIFFKPILTLELIHNGKTVQSLIYNTMLKKKEPHLQYYLLPNNNNERIIEVEGKFKQYQMYVKVVDFLANEEVLNDTIYMKNKVFSERTFLFSSQKQFRLEFIYTTRDDRLKHQDQLKHQEVYANPTNNLHSNTQITLPQNAMLQLILPPLSETILSKIRSYWEKQSQSKGYYNQSNLQIHQILSQSEEFPLTWWVNLKEDEYLLLNIVNTASKIIGFKMLKSFKYIIQVYKQIYSDLEELTHSFISMIINYLRPLYFPEQFKKIQKLHKLLGLEENCDLLSKIDLQIHTFLKITQFECPSMTQKMKRKNIYIGHQILQYIYELYSRNFSSHIIVEVWNFLFKEPDLIQLHLILLGVALMKFYQEQLLKCKRLAEVKEVLESCKLIQFNPLIREVITLKEKYFGQSKGILDEIKNIFVSKPLESVLIDFYKRQTIKLDERKERRDLQKQIVMKKVTKQIDIDLPEYQNKSYCLHIYFSDLPITSGSLYLKCKDVEYECLSYETKKYFIISQINSSVILEYIDNKSNQYTCPLILNQGVNSFNAYLISQKNKLQIKISYMAGLFTDSQIDTFKKGKKFDHYIAPFIKTNDIFEEMCRDILETKFLKLYDRQSNKDDLIKKIKILFASGSKAFNQLEFYLRQIQSSPLTLEEKYNLIKIYSIELSSEYFLCHNQILYKHMLKQFLQIMNFNLNKDQFESYFKESLEYEFDGPKIIKCRFYATNNPTKEVKLQSIAYKYLNERATTFLYSDIVIDEFIQYIKPALEEKISIFTDGELKLLYSSNGEIHLRMLPIKTKNKNKDIYLHQPPEQYQYDDQEEQPEILMTEILPSFTKISTILDFVNTKKTVDLKTKYQDKQKRKVAQSINILRHTQHKFLKVIQMRYRKYPHCIKIPFIEYYYDLLYEQTLPTIKNVFLSNLKTTIKSICTYKGELKFGENAKVSTYTFQPNLGLHGNLRKLTRDAKACYFFTAPKDQIQHLIKPVEAKIFANYGYGVFRWESCSILGYANRVKVRKAKSQQSSHSKPKKQFLVDHQGKVKFVKPYELKLKPGVEERIQQIDQEKIQNRSQKNSSSSIQKQSLKYLNSFLK